MEFEINSNSNKLLDEARFIAREYSEKQITKNTIGIVFLGAVVRGYFDSEADIDIAIFENEYAEKFESKTIKYKKFDLQYFKLDFDNETTATWGMSKRWAYSNIEIYYDTDNKVRSLIDSKTKIAMEERRQLLMQGMALSEWYCNRLVSSWIRRGSIASAHYMFNEGINHLLSAIYIYNNQLVADYKWRLYCLRGLKYTPKSFLSNLEDLLTVKEISEKELERRRETFLRIWKEMLPLIEDELSLKYEVFVNLV